MLYVFKLFLYFYLSFVGYLLCNRRKSIYCKLYVFFFLKKRNMYLLMLLNDVFGGKK